MDIAGADAVCALCREEQVTLQLNRNDRPYWVCRALSTTINLHDDKAEEFLKDFVGKDVDEVPSEVGESEAAPVVESDPDDGEQNREAETEEETDETSIDELLAG